MDRVGDTMHIRATENVDAIVGECSIYRRPHNCAIIGCGIIVGVLYFNLGFNLCTPSFKGCANTIKLPCIEREKNISDIELLHVNIVSMKSIRSETA